jgi:DNA-binding MarR family transcriptional regulator
MLDTERIHTHSIELRLLMHVLWKATSQAIDQWLLEHNMDMTRLQLGVLRMLAHHGPNTISELSRNFSIDPSTLVPTVDAMERKGWLARERDPNDRRRIPLHLTEAGKEALHQVPIIHEDDPLTKAIQAVGEEHTTKVIQLLLDLIQHMPDGEQLIKDVETRLYAHGAKEHHLICRQHKDA